MVILTGYRNIPLMSHPSTFSNKKHQFRGLTATFEACKLCCILNHSGHFRSHQGLNGCATHCPAYPFFTRLNPTRSAP